MSFAKVLTIGFALLISVQTFADRDDFYVVGDETKNTEAALKQQAVINWLKNNNFNTASSRVTPVLAEKYIRFFQKGSSEGFMALKGKVDVDGLSEFGQRYGGSSVTNRNVRFVVQGVNSLRVLKQVEAILKGQEFIQQWIPKEAGPNTIVYSLTTSRSTSDIINALRVGRLSTSDWSYSGDSSITTTLTQ